MALSLLRKKVENGILTTTSCLQPAYVWYVFEGFQTSANSGKFLSFSHVQTHAVTSLRTWVFDFFRYEERLRSRDKFRAFVRRDSQVLFFREYMYEI